MKKYLFLSILLVFCGISQAQLFRIAGHDVGYIYVGPKVGMNLSRISNWEEFVGVTNTNRLGYQIGAIGELGFTRKFSVNGELMFLTKGHKQNFENGYSTFNVPYLGIPLLAKYAFPLFGLSKVYVKGGTFTNIRTGGTLKSVSVDYDEYEMPLESEHWRRVDWGLSIGAGAEYRAKEGIWGLDLRYDHGFVNAHVDFDNSVKHWNRTFAISATYKYDLVKLMLRLRKKHLDPDA